MVIGTGKGPAYSQLTTMALHTFHIDGVRCSSIESLIQSLKFERSSQQATVCADRPKDAKERGKKVVGWANSGNLFWKGSVMGRDSDEYKNFIELVVKEVSRQCPDFAHSLLDTGGVVLSSPGRSTHLDTPVTEAEYCQALTRVRSQLAKRSGLKP